jgi:hypothetical protein
MHTRVTQVTAVTGALLVALMVLLLGAGASPARAAEQPATRRRRSPA